MTHLFPNDGATPPWVACSALPRSSIRGRTLLSPHVALRRSRLAVLKAAVITPAKPQPWGLRLTSLSASLPIEMRHDLIGGGRSGSFRRALGIFRWP